MANGGVFSLPPNPLFFVARPNFQTPRFWPASALMKTTAYFRDVMRQKHPGIYEAWILRVLAEPLGACCA